MNLGSDPINLTGWKFTDSANEYFFPAGTMLASGARLVVAEDILKFNAQHPGVEALGPLDLKNFGVPFLIIYLVSDLGSIFFGWLATRLMQTGWSENAARKLTLLICGSLVLPIWFIPQIHSFNVIVGMFALAMAAHQGWSTNVYALSTTLFPKNGKAPPRGSHTDSLPSRTAPRPGR